MARQLSRTIGLLNPYRRQNQVTGDKRRRIEYRRIDNPTTISVEIQLTTSLLRRTILALNISEMWNKVKSKELWMQKMYARAISLWVATLRKHHWKWHLIPQELGLNSKLKIWSRHPILSKRQMFKSITTVWLEAVTDSLRVIKVRTTFIMTQASWPSEQHSSASRDLVIFHPHSNSLAKAPLSNHLLT